MRKSIISLLLISGIAMAETYTWTGQKGDNKWGTSENWITAGGTVPTALPGYTNTEEDTYIIGDNAVVSADKHSVGNLGASLIVGDNVTLGGNWAFIFKNITIGKNFTSTFSGDGIKWGIDSDVSSTPNTLILNSSYSFSNNILTSIGVGSTVSFGTEGIINLSSDNNQMAVSKLGGKALTLNAEFTLINWEGGPLELNTRYLITGNNIWYRDVTNENKVVDYTASTMSDTNGQTLTKYDIAKSETATWTLNGVAVSEDKLTAGAYRFIATETGGIGVQYFNYIPEPTTATLSLLALSGLAARRRRK